LDAREDRAVWDAWYPIGSPVDIRRHNRLTTTLLGRTLELTVHRTWISASMNGEALPVTERLGLVWTTLGRPNRAPEPLIEYYEVDRQTLNVSTPVIACSGLRLIATVMDTAGDGFLVSDLKTSASRTDSLNDNGAFCRDGYGGHVVPLDANGAFRWTTTHPFSALLSMDQPTFSTNAVKRFDFFGVYGQPVDAHTVIAHALVAVVDPASDHFAGLAHHVATAMTALKTTLENSDRAPVLQTPYGDWLSQKALRYGVDA
jgi:hypothetical protein